MRARAGDPSTTGVNPRTEVRGRAIFPSESVSFNYGSIKWTYTQQKRADGSQGGNTTGGWSLVDNKVAA